VWCGGRTTSSLSGDDFLETWDSQTAANLKAWLEIALLTPWSRVLLEKLTSFRS
jgi:hypothetical protein